MFAPVLYMTAGHSHLRAVAGLPQPQTTITNILPEWGCSFGSMRNNQFQKIFLKNQKTGYEYEYGISNRGFDRQLVVHIYRMKKKMIIN